MTITTTQSSISYSGDGVTFVFNFPYDFFSASDINVTLINVATGATTPLANGVDFTVDTLTQNVTLSGAPPSGVTVKMQRLVPLIQPVDFTANDAFPSDTLDHALDYITMALQQISDTAGSAGSGVGGAGGGPATTILNLGAGHGIFAQAVGSQVQLKGLVAGANVTITHNATDIIIAATQLVGALLAVNNLSDVASRQTSLNTLTNVAGGGNEFVLTKDTASGNAIWKVVPTGGGGEANTMTSSGAGSSIVQAKAGVNLPVRSFVAGANMTIVQNANDLTFSASTSGETNVGQNIGVAGTGIYSGKVGVTLQFKGLAAGAGLSMANNATDVTPAVNQAYPFVFTGSPQVNLGAFVPDHVAGAFPTYALRLSTTLPASSTPAILKGGLVCNMLTPANSWDYGWSGMFYCRTDSTVTDPNPGGTFGRYGESVALTGVGHTYGKAPIWGLQIIAEELGPYDTIMHGFELDLCAQGLDPSNIKKGMAIYFGDRYPNTFNAGGPTTRQFAGIVIAPFVARNQLGYGMTLNGNISEGIGAANTGASALSTYGTYSTAALNLAGMTSTPIAISIPGGSKIKFRSDDSANLGNSYWFPGAFVPNYVGAIAIIVDSTTLYIPICNNHP